MKSFYLSISLVLSLVVSCTSPSSNVDDVLANSIKAHGFDKLDQTAIRFEFRNRIYTLDRTGNDYVYTRSFEDSIGSVVDSLVNSSEFSRKINGNTVTVNAEWTGKYSNSINSVLYFFQVPFILQDQAVRKELLDDVTIEGQQYFTLKVTFDANNGGDDFDDEFRYWINKENYTIDYFAYNYQTDGGGTRFRKAINRKEVGPFTVQDYLNMAGEEKFPPLDKLPSMYEKGELREVSRIINQNVDLI